VFIQEQDNSFILFSLYNLSSPSYLYYSIIIIDLQYIDYL